jgi:hypothetical protein
LCQTTAQAYSNTYKFEKLLKKQIKLTPLSDDRCLTIKSNNSQSIDVEGLDYEVLISNNWGKYS